MVLFINLFIHENNCKTKFGVPENTFAPNDSQPLDGAVHDYD